MQVQLIEIYSKPTDFKICKDCGRINWYENDYCCNVDCTSNHFCFAFAGVEAKIQKEYDFWMEAEGYSEEETDNLFMEV